MPSHLSTTRRLLFILLAGLVMFMMLFSRITPIFSAIQNLENIRVALFINNYRFSSPPAFVTLQGAGGLDVRIGNDASQQVWLSVPQTESVRVSLNQYAVQMADTTDFQLAKSLYTVLVGISKNTYMFKQFVGQQNHYIVQYGSFGSMDEAVTARDQALLNANLASFVKVENTLVTGPLRWQLATFTQYEEAKNKADVLNAAGIETTIALQNNTEGTLNYKLWIGHETSDDALETLKQQVAAQLSYKKLYVMDGNASESQLLRPFQDADGNKVYILDGQKAEPTLMGLSQASVLTESDVVASLLDPDEITFSKADLDSPYMLMKSDVSLSNDGINGLTHLVAGTNEQKTNFNAKQIGVTIKEKSNRTYRGHVEVSAYSNKLAVINELPLEEYLYAVAGSELSSSFPLDALKAQVVAARTYAIMQGEKYGIANISDTTYDQAYSGMGAEFPNAIKAVTDTTSEVLVNQSGKLITPFYSSNAGGVSAVGTEVWGYDVSYLASVSSPDSIAAVGKTAWYNVKLADGREGYVRSDFLTDTGKVNDAKIPIYKSTDNGVNVRLAPYVDNVANPGISKLALNDEVLMIGQTVENNNYNWIKGPYDEQYILSRLNTIGMNIEAPLTSLEVTKRGPSGRVMEMKVNGKVIQVSYPDAFRTLWGGLSSTKFEVKQVNAYLDTPPSGLKLAKKQYLFIGYGFGHGLGMSQWGAKALALQGANYQTILKTYYQNVGIVRNE